MPSDTTELMNDQRPTVNLAPVKFGETFTHPCFWIIIGIVGTLACQCFLDSRRERNRRGSN